MQLSSVVVCSLLIVIGAVKIPESRLDGLTEAEWLMKAKEMGRAQTVWREEDWKQVHVETPHEKYGSVIKTTYTSPIIPLEAGGAHFTLNPITYIPFPKGSYSLLGADFRIMDESGSTDTSLSEVYVHHWLLGTASNINPLIPCERSDNMFFGAGAEMRGMPTVLPEGFGVRRIDVLGHCGGNIHLIRTADLKTEWEGLNNPKGSLAAATKNCIECGWAPHRSDICLKSQDGVIDCCLTGSRCPVNHPEDHTTHNYTLQYDVTWTRNLKAVSDIHMGFLDVSGDSVEWDIAPGMQNDGTHTHCDDTLCNISNTWTVGHEYNFSSQGGVCAGTMKWAYTHQHVGGINSTMFVNGEEICTSVAQYGTDPKNTPGNELGYVVNFTRCIDDQNLGNGLRLDKGDNITLHTLYDVDAKSKRAFPMPGGKHGGIMALFFYYMSCDAGTFEDEYVCAQDSCVPVSLHSHKGKYKDLDSCLLECGI